jgi:hypothetical protein
MARPNQKPLSLNKCIPYDQRLFPGIMKPTLILLLLLTGCKLTAQRKGVVSLDLSAGYKSFDRSFQKQFNAIDNFSFSKPLQTVGLNFGGHFEDNQNGEEGHRESSLYFSYSYILPQPVLLNDSVSCMVSGFSIGQAYGWDFLKENKNLDILLGLGANTGRTKFYRNNLARQQNFFFSPKVCLQPKIAIKKVVLTLTIEYEYDISNPNWKKAWFAKGEQIKLDRLRQNAFTTVFGIGYRLN